MNVIQMKIYGPYMNKLANNLSFCTAIEVLFTCYRIHITYHTRGNLGLLPASNLF